jgi:hypothetical protein
MTPETQQQVRDLLTTIETVARQLSQMLVPPPAVDAEPPPPTKKPAPNQVIDNDRLHELWAAGLNDKQIALHFRVTGMAVCSARRRLGLPTRWQGRKFIAEELPLQNERIQSIWPAVHFLRERGLPVLEASGGRFSIDGRIVDYDDILRRANVKRQRLGKPLFERGWP